MNDHIRMPVAIHVAVDGERVLDQRRAFGQGDGGAAVEHRCIEGDGAQAGRIAADERDRLAQRGDAVGHVGDIQRRINHQRGLIRADV